MACKIIQFETARKEILDRKSEETYRTKLLYMEKAALLNELLRYYDDVKNDPFDIDVALRGEDIFDVMSIRCLTKEMSDLIEEMQSKSNFEMFGLSH